MNLKFDDCISCANRGKRICRRCDVGEYFTDEETADTVDRLNITSGSVTDDDIIVRRDFDPDRFAEAFDNEDEDAED